MTKVKIYHNPRCSKSRTGLQILEEAKIKFEIIKYLDNSPSKKEIEELLQMLNISAIDLVRKGEKIWKENYKGKELSNDEVIDAMFENPKLIERPIVIKGNKAVIGRPTEKIIDLIK